MSENLELRRAALLACGWTFRKSTRTHAGVKGCVIVSKPGGRSSVYGDFASSSMNSVLYLLPAVESDPGAFWPWFLAVCRTREWHWRFKGGSLVIDDDCTLYKATSGVILTSQYGANPCEAGCKAVVAARRKEA